MSDATQNTKATETAKKKRTIRTFPATSFLEAEEFAKRIWEFGSGQQVRRLSLFDHLQKSPESGPSRQLITNSNKYGLIKGSAASDMLELTVEAKILLDESKNPRERARNRIKLAIEDIDPFHKLYRKFVGNKYPAKAALIDSAKEFEVSDDVAEECVDTFSINVRDVGLLQTLSGAERFVTVEHFLDSLGAKPSAKNEIPERSVEARITGTNMITADTAEYEKTAFYISPIGEEGSDQRKHSDLFLGSIVEPAIEKFGLNIIRADQIDKPGIITRQIIEYIAKSRLVIADLSFHNPNVFYELAIRHMLKKPVVQIMRKADKIPFDVNQVRTIIIDTTDIYSLLPKIEIIKSEISNQVRRALDDPDAVDSPIAWLNI